MLKGSVDCLEISFQEAVNNPVSGRKAEASPVARGAVII